MKKIIKKLLYGNTVITDFASIPKPLDEKVILKIEGHEFDISACHWLLCLQPMTYVVWLTNRQVRSLSGEIKEAGFEFKSGNRTVAKLKLLLTNRLDLDEGNLYFLKEVACHIYQLTSLETHLLFYKYYSKPELPFERFRSLVAAYSFPRKVRLISVVKDDYYNLFPMDLLGPVPGTNKFIFGLRHTNISLDKIITGRKIVVSEFPFSHKQEVFSLGRHHSTSPPSLSNLGFGLLKTKLFQFPLPEWVSSYYEIEIQESLDLGSQMFLMGDIKYLEERIKNGNGLYEIHFLYLLYLKRKRGISFLDGQTT